MTEMTNTGAEIKLSDDVRNKLVEGLKNLSLRFWQDADSEDLIEYLAGVLTHGDKGRKPYVYRSDEELVEELIEWNVDAALELFLIAPCEDSRMFPLETIRTRLEEQAKQ